MGVSGKDTHVRFNVAAAIALGILLPTLETVRRGFGYWFVNFTTMFEDYAAGLALLVCAVGMLRGARWAPAALLVVWSGITFMMLISTVSQVEHHLGEHPEPHSGIVLLAKVLLLLVCVLACVQSLRDRKATGRDS
ncbi:MAG TPA: hypothetical protein VKB34_22600 [Povalibacter sp.]|nr:hypothetical protein [Povalibacter sp.]